jgi:hypothetical protein
MRSPLRIVAVLAIAVLAGACGSSTASPSRTPGPPPASGSTGCSAAADPGTPAGWGQPTTKPSVVPVLINASAELTCGPNRLLFSFLDAASNAPVGKPDRTASVAIFDLARDPAKPVATADGTFIWAIVNERGIYVANVSFPEAGVWGAEFTTAVGGVAEKIRMTFQVSPTTPVVRVGAAAPPTKTPTAADVGGDPAKISTDKAPDKALYQRSVDDAIAKHEPFLLVFATPKFCKSAQCGPTLDRIKPFVSKYPSVKFIHVEPYKLALSGGQLQPVLTNNDLTPIDAVNQWGLLTEPWVFVVDRNGIVRGSFELMFSDAELTAALDAVK